MTHNYPLTLMLQQNEEGNGEKLFLGDTFTYGVSTPSHEFKQYFDVYIKSNTVGYMKQF